jgi:predicted  nucleic acid-binding Zn-ribbon protein
MSQPFKLFRLQQIDSQIDKFKTRLREIEIELQEDSELRKANQRVEQAQQLMHETEKALRTAEADVLAQRIKIEETEAALYGGKVRNPKELQDSQQESGIEAIQINFEDRQPEIMPYGRNRRTAFCF